MAALEQMIVLFIMMLIGYAAFCRGMLTKNTTRQISGLVVNIANPALILSSIVGDTANISTDALLLTVPVAIGMYGFLILVSLGIPRVFGFPKKDWGLYRAMTVFNNIGFMGFPIIRSMFGSEALLYTGSFMFFYNVLIYTYGIRAIGGGQEEKQSVGKIFNVGVIACIIALLLFLLRVPLPGFLGTSIDMLSNLTAPLSMMCIGASMADMDLKNMFLDGKMLLFAAAKLILIPVAGMWMLKLVLHHETILGVCMVMLATPVGSMTSMLAQEYGGNYEEASKAVAVTSCLSVFTIPLVAMLVL